MWQKKTLNLVHFFEYSLLTKFHQLITLRDLIGTDMRDFWLNDYVAR
jgi:hypothetical protein